MAIPEQPEVAPPTTPDHADHADPGLTADRRDELAALPSASVCPIWLPLGAGGRSVRWNGLAFEMLVAHHEHREVRDLYHSALEVRVGPDRFVIEMTPVWATGLPTSQAQALLGSPLALRSGDPLRRGQVDVAHFVRRQG